MGRESYVSSLERYEGERGGGICLDACCNSGMDSLVLRGIGIYHLAYDNDPSLLSRDLMNGRLLPEETIWMDASGATRYLKPDRPWIAPHGRRDKRVQFRPLEEGCRAGAGPYKLDDHHHGD